MLIGNDSSAAHLATAFDVPAHVLFGSSSPDLCAPEGDFVSVHYIKDACPIGPCNKMDCILQKILCMQALSPSTVLESLKTHESLLSSV
jgi:ADP-heptose:LPS heptosyltransferase